MTTPRYFAPRTEDAPSAVPLFEPEAIVSILSALRVPTSHGAPAEWVIARMLGGELVPLPIEERALWPPRLQQVLASHEVAGGTTLELDAREVHFFEIELLEQSPDAPGLDDPVHLYGALSGPFPPRPDAPSCVRRGQLTVTRADLLAGLCRGVASAFVLPPADGATRRARSIAAVLPGDRDAAIQVGEGIVVALPLLPAELALSDASNELVVSQLLHDVLAMLRDDARATQPEHPLARLDLAVPDRKALEARLETDGWTVVGDVATKKKPEQAGLLASVVHAIAAETKTLPREASLDEFVALAERVLPTIPGWPSARARSLASRVRAVASSSLRSPSAFVPRVPVAQSAPAEPVPPAAPRDTRAPRPRVSTSRDEWMKDFVGKPDSTPPRPAKSKPAAPRLTPTSKTARPASVPDWMRDFDVDDHDD